MVQVGFLLEGVPLVLVAESRDEVEHFQRYHLPQGTMGCEPCAQAPRFSVVRWGHGLYQARRTIGCRVEELETPTSLERARAQLANHLHLWVAEHCLGRVMIHAGVVAWEERVLLLPGRSLAGKSTLVEALCKEGATYWSDDLAVVWPGGLTTPYRLPLSKRVAHRSAQKVWMPDQEQPLPQGGRVAAVLFCQYTPRARRFLPRSGSAAAGLRELLGHCPGLRRGPEQVLPILTELARTATFHWGRRGEAGRAVAGVRSLMSTSGKSNDQGLSTGQQSRL